MADGSKRRFGLVNTVELDQTAAVPPDRPGSERSYPEALASRYFIQESKGTTTFYHDYKGKDEAFRLDRNAGRITTPGNDVAAARDVLALAESQGWTTVKVGGAKEFRREAWIEAAARDIEAKGYKPSDLDRQEAQKRRDRREGPERGQPAQRTPDDGTVERTAEARARAAEPVTPLRTLENPASVRARAAKAAASARLPESPAPARAVPAGAAELVDHGTAPYRFEKQNEQSYFVRLRAGDGSESVRWGKELPDALAKVGAGRGDIVTVEKTAEKPVSVSVPVRDADGKVVGSDVKATHRNEWDVAVIERRGPEANVLSLQLEKAARSGRDTSRDETGVERDMARLAEDGLRRRPGEAARDAARLQRDEERLVTDRSNLSDAARSILTAIGGRIDREFAGLTGPEREQLKDFTAGLLVTRERDVGRIQDPGPLPVRPEPARTEPVRAERERPAEPERVRAAATEPEIPLPRRQREVERTL